MWCLRALGFERSGELVEVRGAVVSYFLETVVR